jgi:hypothetical protein
LASVPPSLRSHTKAQPSSMNPNPGPAPTKADKEAAQRQQLEQMKTQMQTEALFSNTAPKHLGDVSVGEMNVQKVDDTRRGGCRVGARRAASVVKESLRKILNNT